MSHTTTQTIMLVDDEKMILECVSEMLHEFCDYDVIIAHGGISALERYKDHWSQIDCVILDMMPDLNGCEVYKHMKAINPNVKVIVMSGYSADKDKEFMRNSCCAFISKPATIQQIHKTILDTIGA